MDGSGVIDEKWVVGQDCKGELEGVEGGEEQQELGGVRGVAKDGGGWVEQEEVGPEGSVLVVLDFNVGAKGS